MSLAFRVVQHFTVARSFYLLSITALEICLTIEKIIYDDFQVIESSGYGADKFTMVRNNDGTGSLKIVQSLDYEDQLQSNGFRFRIQVNDKVSKEF